MDRRNPLAEDVVAYVDECRGGECAICAQALLGHDAVLSLMLGFADAPLCAACIGGQLGREPTAFWEEAHRNVSRLPCYRAGWAYADRLLAAAGPWPEDRIPARLQMPAADSDAPEDGTLDAAQEEPSDLDAVLAAGPAPVRWDAGDRGCGELALELKLRLGRLASGQRLLLQSTDRGAPADIPAWCRLTGNVLVAAHPPRFLIERFSSNPNPEAPHPS